MIRPSAMQAEAVDILIAGGGPVGAALALAFEGSAHSVVLAEARAAGPSGALGATARDARTIALSYASRLILERLGAWSRIAATPIEAIHISQQGGFGRTLIRAVDCDLPALGYVASYDGLQQSLLAPPCSARRLYGARLTGFEGQTAVLQTQEGKLAFAPRLTVLADGARITEDSAAPAFSKDYRQTAVVAWVKAAQAHRGRAWERFTPEGPLALLPHAGGYALVWTTSPERAAHLCTLETPIFLTELHAAFGDRLGAFTEAGERTSFPLVLRYRREETRARALSVGNAAQTLHPVAGQGFNLGLRDAWELGRLAREATTDLGGDDFLAGYRRARALDRRAGVQFTDGLVRLFSNSNQLLKFGRGAGLLVLDLLPLAREFIARRMIYGARALP
ncbi:MAG: FAD-dependent monooxygenase [Pseudomonadota bacterium]